MKKFMVLLVMLTLAACSEVAQMHAEGNCQDRFGQSDPEDFNTPHTKAQVNAYFACMKNETLLSSRTRHNVTMQESLWKQLTNKEISPAQAQKEYTVYKMQADKAAAAPVSTFSPPNATITAPIYKPATSYGSRGY